MRAFQKETLKSSRYNFTTLISQLKDRDTLLRMCGVLVSGLANLFSRLAFGEKIPLHRPRDARECYYISIQELFVAFPKFKRHILFLCGRCREN